MINNVDSRLGDAAAIDSERYEYRGHEEADHHVDCSRRARAGGAGGRAGCAPAPRRSQPPPQPAPAEPLNMDEMRHHIYVMEGALAQAVDFGAKQLNREILAVMPGVFMLEARRAPAASISTATACSSTSRVPMMRQSMMWSLRMMLDQDDAANQALVNDLRK